MASFRRIQGSQLPLALSVWKVEMLVVLQQERSVSYGGEMVMRF